MNRRFSGYWARDVRLTYWGAASATTMMTAKRKEARTIFLSRKEEGKVSIWNVVKHEKES